MQKPYRLRLMDTYRNLFYTPIYTAVAGGFLYAEGLDVMFGTVPTDRPPLDMLRQGEVDIIQSGISRSLMALDDGDEDAPLHIAEINQRDGFFLVSRTPTDNWQWSDLEGATLIPIGFTPVPLTSLTAALRKHSVDIDSITMLKGLSAEDALAAFRRGDADYIHMPNPQAQALIEDGAGYLAASSAASTATSAIAHSPPHPHSSTSSPKSSTASCAASTRRSSGSPLPPRRSSPSASSPSSQVSPTPCCRPVSPATSPSKFGLIPPTSASTATTQCARSSSTEVWYMGRHPYERLVRPEFAQQAMTE